MQTGLWQLEAEGLEIGRKQDLKWWSKKECFATAYERKKLLIYRLWTHNTIL